MHHRVFVICVFVGVWVCFMCAWRRSCSFFFPPFHKACQPLTIPPRPPQEPPPCAPAVTEESAVSLIGSEAFAGLYDFLRRRADAIDEGRTDEVGAAGSIADLSRLVFSIIPYEKAEAVTLVYRYMYLQGQLEEL